MGERRGGRVEKTATRGWEDFVKRFPRDGTFILFTLRISGRNHANSVLSPDHAPSHETDFTARSLAVLFLFSFLRRLSGRWLICFFDDDGKGDQIWIVHKPIEESRCWDSRISFISVMWFYWIRVSIFGLDRIVSYFSFFFFFFLKSSIVKLDITLF